MMSREGLHENREAGHTMSRELSSEGRHENRRDEAVRRYFGQPGFERFLKLLKRQYVSSREGVRGYVTLTNISKVEREALDTFYGTYSPHVPGETKRYSLKKFEQLLLESRFEITTAQLLEILDGKPVLTRHELNMRTKEEWEMIIDQAISEVSIAGSIHDDVKRWAEGFARELSPGSRILRTVFARSREEARLSFSTCIRALAWLKSNRDRIPVRLPVLAAEITGDAHAFDWKFPTGRMLWWGLVAVYGEQSSVELENSTDDPAESLHPSSSQAMVIREGYRRGGVLDDDLSSQVMLYAPQLFGEREERVLTLRQVERLSREKLMHLPVKRVYMVENPSVFAELVDADTENIVVCGNGQPTSAVLKLLDSILEIREEMELFYAGDLDPAGLGIAHSLYVRYREAFRPWCMDRELYCKYADRGIRMTDEELARLREICYEWASELTETMISKGVKLHQELWIDELSEDVKRKTSNSL